VKLGLIFETDSGAGFAGKTGSRLLVAVLFTRS